MDLIVAAVAVGIVFLLIEVGGLRAHNRRLSKQVEHLAERLEAGFAAQGLDLPDRPEVAGVRALMADGKTVEAVRLWRDATGASLVEAKRQVDLIAVESPGAGA